MDLRHLPSCGASHAEHVASMRQLDDALWTEVKNFIKCIIRMNAAKVRGCRHTSMKFVAVGTPQCRSNVETHPHMQHRCLDVPFLVPEALGPTHAATLGPLFVICVLPCLLTRAVGVALVACAQRLALVACAGHADTLLGDRHVVERWTQACHAGGAAMHREAAGACTVRLLPSGATTFSPDYIFMYLYLYI